jgi:hypothetical protein
MKLKDLAYALGISDSMASRLAKKGMPTYSIEAAEKWRAKNLDPSMTKQNRADGNQGGRKGQSGQRTRPAGTNPVAQPFTDDADPLTAYLRETLPARLFDPCAVSAVVIDAGLRISGEKVLRLTAGLYLYYMRLIDPEDVLGCVVPDGLAHRPGSPEFKIVAGIIDRLMERWVSRLEDNSA